MTIAAATPSKAVLITFDNLVGGTAISSPTPVSNQYASLGVTFSDPAGPMGALLGSVVEAVGYSPPNILFANQHQSSDAGDLRLDFSVSTESVSLDAFLSNSYYLTALAYGAGGTLLGSLNSTTGTVANSAIPFTISETSPISYLLLTSHPTFDTGYYGNFGIDDLSFAGTATSTPEPSTWAMMLLSLAGLGFAGYRRAKSGQKAPSAA